eukprot:14561619-Heterocapsa_arctica.AAC.1
MAGGNAFGFGFANKPSSLWPLTSEAQNEVKQPTLVVGGALGVTTHVFVVDTVAPPAAEDRVPLSW